MTLNVDVQGKLIPNIVTMIIQLCSTGVLLFFVHKFLWKPARKYLAKKAELTQKPLDDALAKQQQAELANNQAQEKLHDAAKQAENIVNQGQSEGKKVKADLINQGQVEAKRILDNANKEIVEEKQKMRQDVQKEIVDVALAASEKLLKQQASSEKNKPAIEDFVKDVNNGH